MVISMHTNSRNAFTVIELLVVVTIVSILTAMILPAVQAARAAARRMSCQNNMRQISLALINHEATFKYLPPGTNLSRDRRFQSWCAKILPFMEHSSIFNETEEAFRKSPSAFNARYHENLATTIPTLSCPEDSRVAQVAFAPRNRRLVGLTSYMGSLGENFVLKNGLLYGGSSIRFSEVSDGLSNTILIGERPPSPTNEYGWWYAGVGAGDGTLDHTVGGKEVAKSIYADCDNTPFFFRKGSVLNECSVSHFWSLHNSGANFAFADGAVHFIVYEASDQVLKASTRSGHEIFAVP